MSPSSVVGVANFYYVNESALYTDYCNECKMVKPYSFINNNNSNGK